MAREYHTLCFGRCAARRNGALTLLSPDPLNTIEPRALDSEAPSSTGGAPESRRRGPRDRSAHHVDAHDAWAGHAHSPEVHAMQPHAASAALADGTTRWLRCSSCK